MKRKTKNIIMSIVLIFLIGLMGVTIYFANKHMIINDYDSLEIEEINSNNEPPEKRDGDNDSNEPPEKREDANDNGESMSEPPEKPDEENNSNNDNQPPEVPNNSEFNLGGEVSIIYYVLFGIESILTSSIIIYFLLSKFNKKNFKETFSSSDKVLIFTLSCIILTVVLVFTLKKVTEGISIDSPNKDGDIISPMTGENSVSYSSPNEYTEDTVISKGSYSSDTPDQNAILVSGDIDVTLSNIEVTKTGDSDGGDDSNFYGNNSGIIAKDGANLVLKDITVTTDATGANGVFSYGGSATTNNTTGDGTTITISDSVITTTKDNAGGIMTTGGGIMKASNLSINTAGVSSAAIRTDRGGGTVEVEGGSYTTSGAGSPTIYSTANITVNDAKLVAKVSEGIVIEGKNTVTIDNCNLTDSNTKLNGLSTTYKNIFLYQSMSGDAASGNAEFTSKNSKIETNNGDTFYVTNTTATINLENNTIINNDANGNFLRVKKDSWGNDGSNGGDVVLNLTNQEIIGNIVIDSISTLDITMKSNSYYEGIINGDNSAKEIKLTLDKTSKIKLTGDSYITELSNADSSNSNIDFNGYKLYVDGNAIN